MLCPRNHLMRGIDALLYAAERTVKRPLRCHLMEAAWALFGVFDLFLSTRSPELA